MELASANRVDAIYDLGISHNKFGVPLPDGTIYPDHAADVSGKRALEFLTQFNRVRERDWSDCSFVDLGCSEGSTTFEISQMDSTVYGVEGREDAVRRAQALRSILGFEKTYFSVGNVNDPSIYRAVDGIFNAGILYHLDDPVTCLQRCAETAALFVYLDTGHAPRDEAERMKSKFAPKFGKSYKIAFQGLDLDAIDFAEPNVSERQADGTRRGPRSAIGNSTSVWLSHESTIKLMAQLGFPYHETLSDAPKFPRLRTCFFRSPPRPTQPIGPFLRPLPDLPRRKEALLRSRERDVDYIRRSGEPVLLVGRDPLLSEIRAELRASGISIREEIAVPGEGPIARGVLNQLTQGKNGLVVAAVPDAMEMIRHFTILDRFHYAFGSFALARQ